AGGAAGVSAAFNTPIAGIVFAVEELAKGFDKRATSVVILAVVSAGVAAFALGGNYAYFGDLAGSAGWSTWLSAPLIGVGAGLGALFAHVAPWAGGREAVTLGMAAYLTGVVQAPLTSAVILMEMTRDPGLVGPLLLSCLVARKCSEMLCPVPLYHTLARAWT